MLQLVVVLRVSAKYYMLQLVAVLRVFGQVLHATTGGSAESLGQVLQLVVVPRVSAKYYMLQLVAVLRVSAKYYNWWWC